MYLSIVRLKAVEWAVTLLIGVRNHDASSIALINQMKQWPAVGKGFYDGLIMEIQSRFPGNYDSKFEQMKASCAQSR